MSRPGTPRDTSRPLSNDLPPRISGEEIEHELNTNGIDIIIDPWENRDRVHLSDYLEPASGPPPFNASPNLEPGLSHLPSPPQWIVRSGDQDVSGSSESPSISSPESPHVDDSDVSPPGFRSPALPEQRRGYERTYSHEMPFQLPNTQLPFIAANNPGNVVPDLVTQQSLYQRARQILGALKPKGPLVFLVISTGISWYVIYLVQEARVTRGEYCHGDPNEPYAQFCQEHKIAFADYSLVAVALGTAYTTLLTIKRFVEDKISVCRSYLTSDRFRRGEEYGMLANSCIGLVAVFINSVTDIPGRFMIPPTMPPMEQQLMRTAQGRDIQVVVFSGVRALGAIGMVTYIRYQRRQN